LGLPESGAFVKLIYDENTQNLSASLFGVIAIIVPADNC